MLKSIKKTIFLCCFAMLCFVALGSSAQAATNPTGETINGGMNANTLNDPSLNNYGTILGGLHFSVLLGGSDIKFGMFGEGNKNYNFTNTGTINILDHVDSNRFVLGMAAISEGGIGNNNNHTLTNSGTITTTVTASPTIGGAYSFIMYASGDGSHTLSNSGTITATATGDAANVIAMQVEDHSKNNLYKSTITNSGTITLTATGGDAGAVAMIIDTANSTVTNSGTIIAKATATGDALVNGINIVGAPGTQGHLINNTGFIDVSATSTGGAARAYEAYGDENFNVGTWATTLKTWSANATVFGLANLKNVTFRNSKLILRPGTAAQGFSLGKVYNVANMVAVEVGPNMTLQDSTSTAILGTIASVETEVPFLKATLTNGADPKNATVKIESNVNESTTPGATSMQQSVAQVQSQFNNLSTSLRNALVTTYTNANLQADAGTSGVAAGSTSTANKWQVFLTPYANAVNNSEYDFDGSNMGITGGASYRVNDKFSFGAHLDFNAANYYGEIMDMNTKSTSFALGLHAAYNFMPEWYLRAQLTGSISQTDSEYELNGVSPFYADASYSGEALYLALASGYTWQIAKGHSLTPEIGLAYLSTHTSAYDIEWSGAVASALGGLYDLNYEDSYYSAVYATLNLDWRSEWELENNSSIAVLAGLGLRQNLGNGEIETNLRMLGSSYSTMSTEDQTTFLVDAGLEYKKDNFSVSLNYEGGFGSRQTTHGGNLMLKLEF